MSIDFTGLPTATLLDLRGKYIECLGQIAVVGQSYSIGSRSFTFADIEAVKRTLMQIEQALAAANGRVGRRTLGNFSNR